MIRKPAVAGTFYPIDRGQLSSEIDSLLDNVTIKDNKDPIGFVCPHAGYIFSCITAAVSFKHLV